jgi:hypothetical protein
VLRVRPRPDRLHAHLNPRNTLFLVLLMSLLITRYDRYRTRQERRIDHAEYLARLHPATAEPAFGSSKRIAAERTA